MQFPNPLPFAIPNTPSPPPVELFFRSRTRPLPDNSEHHHYFEIEINLEPRPLECPFVPIVAPALTRTIDGAQAQFLRRIFKVPAA